MTLLQALFGLPVSVIGDDGKPEAEEGGNGWADKLREVFNFAENWQYDPFPCQNCGRGMRGPHCPYCNEWQAGYDYNH